MRLSSWSVWVDLELFDEKDIVGCGYRKKYRNGGVSYPFDLKRKVEWCVNREMNELIAPNPMRGSRASIKRANPRSDAGTIWADEST